MRISDWSSDVCSSDLQELAAEAAPTGSRRTITGTPMQSNRQTRQTIVRLLSGMGSTKEIRQYLKRFSQLDAARFAVVKVGGAVLRDELDALVSSLALDRKSTRLNSSH